MPTKTYTTRNRKQTNQTEPIPGSGQVKNSAGGYSFELDKWKRFLRFLILGSEGGTYYIGEKTLTRHNASNVEACIQEDPTRAVNLIVDISDAGRAPKNDPALFALALAAASENADARRLALAALPKVARIGTHLHHFNLYVDGMRGWGRGLREANAAWMNDKEPLDLARQFLKYPSRDGWSFKDTLILSHPTPTTATHNWLYNYVVNGVLGEIPEYEPARTLVHTVETLKIVESVESVVGAIRSLKLEREMIPTLWLTDEKVWAALVPNLGYTALIRNLGNLSKCGWLKDGKFQNIEFVTKKLLDLETINKSRVHPIQLLAALLTYSQGHGMRGKGEWPVVPQVVDALDEAFYLAFGNITPTGKRIYIAADVSGSMYGANVAGVPGLTAGVGAGALALLTARTEKNYVIRGFSHQLVDLGISPKLRLDSAVDKMRRVPMGGTDCALPMLDALKNGTDIDAFMVITDNETWAGNIHPVQALKQYRDRTGIPARLIVVGMTATEFSIADPNDAGMLDVVGFDTAAPELMSQFIRGEI